MQLGTATDAAETFPIGGRSINIAGGGFFQAYSAIGISAAYGVATGLISFNITLSYGSYNVTVNGALGSEAHGGASVM